MIIEAAFTDGNRRIANELAQFRQVARGVEARSIVGMNSSRGEDETGARSRVFSGGGRRRERLANADDRDRARFAGASDYRVAVAGERRVREVGVAVDED